MSWRVIHDPTGLLADGPLTTKKAATAKAAEMTDAHDKIGAKHNGEPVTFSVEKVDNPQLNEEPAA